MSCETRDENVIIKRKMNKKYDIESRYNRKDNLYDRKQ